MQGTRKNIEPLLSTVKALSSLPSLREYLIGHTRLPAWRKAAEYRRVGFEHFVVLVDKLSRAESLEIENALQRAIFSGTDSQMFQKYHSEKRTHGVLSRSFGGSSADPTAKECSVYVVWY